MAFWARSTVFGLVGGFCLVSGRPAGAADCVLTAKAALPLAKVPGVAMAPAHIDGTATWLVIDTGAVRSMVQDHAANAMKLERESLDDNLGTAGSLTTSRAPVVPEQRLGRGGGISVSPQALNPQIDVDKIALLNREQIEAYSIYGGGGRQITQQTRGHRLGLGALDIAGASFLIVPDLWGTDAPIAGMVGMDVLRAYDVELDLADNFVNLFSPDHCAGNVVYWAKDYLKAPITVNRDGQVLLDVTLDGKPVQALLDTGTGESSIDQAVANWRFGVTTDTPGVTRVGETREIDGSALPSYAYQFKSLELAGITFHNPTLRLVPTRRPPSSRSFDVHNRPVDNTPELILGLSQLRKLRLYLALNEGTLYVTPAAPPAVAKAD